MLRRAWLFYEEHHRIGGVVELMAGILIMGSGVSGSIVAAAAVIVVPRLVRT